MTETADSPFLIDRSEDYGVYSYFLGSSIPTGAQTVQVSVDGTGSTKVGGCITVTAAADTEIQDTGTADTNQDTVFPTLALGGNSCFCALALASASNLDSSVTPSSGWTERYEADIGSEVFAAHTYDTIGTSDVDASISNGTTYRGYIAVAIKESASSGSTGTLTISLESFLTAFLGTTTVLGAITNTLETSPIVLNGSVGSPISGTIENTLQDVTTSLNGTTVVLGSIANQLEDVSTGLTGTVTIVGSITNTLEDLITDLEGVVETSEVTGTITVTLQDAPTVLNGSTTVTGSITVTLDAANSSMEGTTTVVGTIANQLDNVTMYFTGFPGAEGFIARLRTLLGCGT